MLVAIAAYCIVLAVIAATAVGAAKGNNGARRRNISANAQATAQQAAGTSDRKPLKGTAQTSKGSRTRGVLTSSTALALGAGAVVLIVAAAGGITWYRAGHKAAEETGWQPPTCAAPTAGDVIKRFMAMTDFTYPINTASKTAQRLFDIGLLQAWNFNQQEAMRAFRMAEEADPSAAMVHFGQAYALGPGANRDVTSERKLYPSFAPEDFPAVYKASQKALKTANLAIANNPDSLVAKKEMALAIALAQKRFPEGSAAGDRRHAAEEEYAQALAKVGGALNDAAVMAMAAEAFMNLSPWDYYQEGNELKESASHAEELINTALAADPKNPLALHLHIHIAEASTPQRGPHLNAARAETSAQRLLTNEGPWTHGFGHLQHMPSHTFVRLGQWHNAVVSNVNAYNSDVSDGAACMSPYEPEHNTDMLIYAANMAGEFRVAEQFGQLMRQYPVAIPTAYGDDYGADWTHLILTYVIQGRWDAIMELPGRGPPKGARALCPGGGYEYAVAVYHYARTLALAAKAVGVRAAGETGDFYDAYVEGAAKSLERLRAAESVIEEEERTVPGEAPGIYACDYKKLAQIHCKVAEGRVELLHGRPAEAAAALQAAHEMEAGMGYMEPPRLYQPVKHCLGYVLMQAGNPQKAAEVFVESMMDTPNSGFALYGLADSLRSLNRTQDAAQMHEVYKKAWENADGPLDSPCPSFSRTMSPALTPGGRKLLA